MKTHNCCRLPTVIPYRIPTLKQGVNIRKRRPGLCRALEATLPHRRYPGSLVKIDGALLIRLPPNPNVPTCARTRSVRPLPEFVNFVSARRLLFSTDSSSFPQKLGLVRFARLVQSRRN